MSDDCKWGIVEPFDTDGSALDGLSRQMCFCLGAEFVAFRNRLLSTPSPFSDLCLPANAERISAMANRHRRFCEVGPETDGWCIVRVGDQLV